MASIILPIKEKYVKALFDGSKKFELRRRAPKQNIKTIFVYQTNPTSKIVGKLLVKKTHYLTINKLWELTKNKNSLTKKELITYFKDQNYGYAFEISTKRKFIFNKKIQKYNLKQPPRGFVYKK